MKVRSQIDLPGDGETITTNNPVVRSIVFGGMHGVSKMGVRTAAQRRGGLGRIFAEAAEKIGAPFLRFWPLG